MQQQQQQDVSLRGLSSAAVLVQLEHVAEHFKELAGSSGQRAAGNAHLRMS
jgi:hypothetical protein